MRQLLFLGFLILVACDEPVDSLKVTEENWASRRVALPITDSLTHGKSYLSVYSQIYSFSQNQKFNLTGMISLRNISDVDTIHLLRADYFNTQGTKIRTYFDYPVYLAPMETVEIVIDQIDVEGGTGSNFLFEWSTPGNCPEPLFEGVMTSLQGTQGLSFVTTAKRIE